MISILNLQSSAGLPLCITGITHPLSLSKEIADHDLRRDAIKQKKTEEDEEKVVSENIADQEEQQQEEEEEEEEEMGDFVFDLSNKKCLPSAAKAA